MRENSEVVIIYIYISIYSVYIYIYLPGLDLILNKYNLMGYIYIYMDVIVIIYPDISIYIYPINPHLLS